VTRWLLEHLVSLVTLIEVTVILGLLLGGAV
jgi:hypothetical protein